MGLRLRDVPAARGWAWVRDGLAAWRSQPLAFTALFLAFMLGVMLVAALLPLAGGAVGAALMPLASLGFMAATRDARAGARPRLAHLAEGWRGADTPRRRAQLVLAAVYALGAVAVFTTADVLDGGAFERWQHEAAQSSPRVPASSPAPTPAPLPVPPSASSATSASDGVAPDARLLEGLALRMALGVLLAVPFWHAPALVHWAGHGAAQALFASTLAVWRARGAFALYAAAWAAIAALASIVLMVAARLAGLGAIAGVVATAAVTALSAAFYASLWFTFDDSFDGAAGAVGATPRPPPTNPPDRGDA